MNTERNYQTKAKAFSFLPFPSHAPSKYFQILYIFAQIFKYFALFKHFFALFQKNCMHDLTF